MSLDIGLDLWTAGDGTIMPSVLDDFQQFSLPSIDENDSADFAQMFLADMPDPIGDEGTDMVAMFSKPSVELDPSLYSFGAA